MGGEARSTAILRFLRKIAFVDLGILAFEALICWLGDWLTAKQFGNGLICGGMAVVAFGVYSVFGGWGLSRDPRVLYAQSASEQSMTERTKQSIRAAVRSYDLSIVWVVAGVIAILAGALVQTL